MPMGHPISSFICTTKAILAVPPDTMPVKHTRHPPMQTVPGQLGSSPANSHLNRIRFYSKKEEKGKRKQAIIP